MREVVVEDKKEFHLEDGDVDLIAQVRDMERRRTAIRAAQKVVEDLDREDTAKSELFWLAAEKEIVRLGAAPEDLKNLRLDSETLVIRKSENGAVKMMTIGQLLEHMNHKNGEARS